MGACRLDGVEVPGALGQAQVVRLDSAGPGAARAGRDIVEGDQAALVDRGDELLGDLVTGQVRGEDRQAGGAAAGRSLTDGAQLGQGPPGRGGKIAVAPGGGGQAQAGGLLGAQVQRGKGVVLLDDPVPGLLGASGGGHLDTELAQRVLVPLELAASRERIRGGVRQAVSRHTGHELLGTETSGGVAQGEQKAHQTLLGATGRLAHGAPA